MKQTSVLQNQASCMDDISYHRPIDPRNYTYISETRTATKEVHTFTCSTRCMIYIFTSSNLQISSSLGYDQTVFSVLGSEDEMR